MISLDQIRALEGRIEKAVALIQELRSENGVLVKRLVDTGSQLSRSESRAADLESRLQSVTVAEAAVRDELSATEARLAATEARAALAEAKTVELARENEVRAASIRELEEKAADSDFRVLELEDRAEELRREQLRIEEGITAALGRLDEFEDLALDADLNEGETSDGLASPGETISAGSETLSRVDAILEDVLNSAESSVSGADSTVSDESYGVADPESGMDASGGQPVQAESVVERGAFQEEAAVETRTADVAQERTFRESSDGIEIF